MFKLTTRHPAFMILSNQRRVSWDHIQTECNCTRPSLDSVACGSLTQNVEECSPVNIDHSNIETYMDNFDPNDVTVGKIKIQIFISIYNLYYFSKIMNKSFELSI